MELQHSVVHVSVEDNTETEKQTNTALGIRIGLVFEKTILTLNAKVLWPS